MCFIIIAIIIIIIIIIIIAIIITIITIIIFYIIIVIIIVIIGIRGNCYQFIKNLYLTSKASVKIDDQYSESFNIMKGVRQGCPLSLILFNLFINDIFNDFSELGIPLCCGRLFANNIVLCAQSRTKLKKMLKKVNEWSKFNMMNFRINKCATMVNRPDTPLFHNKKDPTFHLSGQPIPITKCYTYLGIPFDKSLSLNPIIKLLNSKVTKALFSVIKFLSNSKIPIPFKKIIINSYVLSKVSYFALLLDSNKTRTNNTQKLINKGLRWITGLQKTESFINVYSISKDLNILYFQLSVLSLKSNVLINGKIQIALFHIK